MAYNYNTNCSTEHYVTLVDTAASYGYFEHKILGDDCAGGLWFYGKKLANYDGVYELPSEVATALIAEGFVLSEEFLHGNVAPHYIKEETR